jgi:translation initiation factor IF-2
MSEEQEKKEKPKATLIKHRKSGNSSGENDGAAKPKKVVVVKKKVVKKKATPKVVARPVTAAAGEQGTKDTVKAEKTTEKPTTVTDRGAEGKTKESGRTGSGPVTGETRQTNQRQRPQTTPRREPRTQDRPSPRSGQQGRDQSSRGPRGRSGFDGPAKDRNYTGGRGTGGRSQDGGQRSGSPRSSGRGNSGPPRGGTGRFPGRPSGPRSSGPGTGTGSRSGSGAPSPSEGKKGGKKFFKSKKKDAYSKSKKPEVQERNFQIKKKNTVRANPVPKEVDIMEVITVSELARKMNLKVSELIGKLMSMGMMVTINQQIDAETAQLLADEYGCKVKIVSLYDETIIESDAADDAQLQPRPPIVTIMGHVDHGKTQLLDTIRSTNVIDDEFGGITQHIGAYQVSVNDQSIVFLDTPGHEAFTLMRARGAQFTDIVVLVVAANDGAMPQTIEAINHAKEAKVPILVAVNKIDLPEANPDRVKQQLSEHNLIPEDWGGDTLYVEVSALKGDGVPELLESILLQTELMDLKANYDCRAEGKVIESKVDHGRGIVSTVIIESGTLNVGDPFVAGVYPGKVRAMFNDRGKKIETATPAMPVEVLGFTGIPNAGDPFQVTENDRSARQVGVKRQELEKQGEAMNVKKVTLDNLYDSIQEGAIQELKVIIKGDVHGSVEALQTALEKLSTKEIKLTVIHAAAGAIVENDVSFASASNAIIIGFHVRPTPKALDLAEQEKVEIRKYNVIYDAVADIRDAMEGMLAPEIREEVVGTVEVRETFKVPKIGLIAGCYVNSGKVRRGSTVHIIRDGIEIHTGTIHSLKRFKDDAREVEAGYECGIGVDGYLDIRVGDVLEIFEEKQFAKKL